MNTSCYVMAVTEPGGQLHVMAVTEPGEQPYAMAVNRVDNVVS